MYPLPKMAEEIVTVLHTVPCYQKAPSIPKELFTQGALENLAKLVENKGGLMARAFQAGEIRLTVTEDAVSFPWFPFTVNLDETVAYTEFVEKLCGMARSMKR